MDDMWGRGRGSCGVGHGGKLTTADIEYIRGSTEKGVDLANRFQVTPGHISRVRRGIKRNRGI